MTPMQQQETNGIPLLKKRMATMATTWTSTSLTEVSVLLYVHRTLLIRIPLGEEPWPGQYIDITRARRPDEEHVSWPRPG